MGYRLQLKRKDRHPLCSLSHWQIQTPDAPWSALSSGRPPPCQAAAQPLLPAGHPCQLTPPICPTCSAPRVSLAPLTPLHPAGQVGHQQVQLDQPEAVPVHPHRHLCPPCLAHSLPLAAHHNGLLHQRGGDQGAGDGDIWAALRPPLVRLPPLLPACPPCSTCCHQKLFDCVGSTPWQAPVARSFQFSAFSTK